MVKKVEEVGTLSVVPSVKGLGKKGERDQRRTGLLVSSL